MDTNKVVDTLIDMKNDSEFTFQNPTGENHRKLMDKYNSLFLGEKFNKVTSLEFAHYLTVDHGELLKILPAVTQQLDMELETMRYLESNDIGKTDVYVISLH